MTVDCALVVGHRKSAGGASGHGVQEWPFWSQHAQTLAGLLGERGVRTTVIHRDDTRFGYSQLPHKVLGVNPRCVVSLHLNAASASATGTETLVAAGDEEDMRLAELVQAAMVRALGLRDRGIKPVQQNHRGGSLMFALWHVPAVLIEPCFVSNAGDVAALKANLMPMLSGVAYGVATYLGAGR